MAPYLPASSLPPRAVDDVWLVRSWDVISFADKNTDILVSISETTDPFSVVSPRDVCGMDNPQRNEWCGRLAQWGVEGE